MSYLNRLLLLIMLAFACTGSAQEMPEGRLMRFPDIHKDKIAFMYGGDLWLASSAGGVARRITTHAGTRTVPKIFARRQMDRLHRTIRRQLQCLCDARRGRPAPATDVLSGSRRAAERSHGNPQ